jgi:enamine deaminase RidA (YjgF/YER057c/UK114 family)
MPIQRIQPKDLPQTTAYSQVVRAGTLVCIAGQVAADASGKLVGEGDCEAQATQAFENLRRALASVGGTFSNLVRMTVYLTRAENIDAYRRVRAKYLTGDKPASTLVVIDRLLLPDYLIEIEAMAVLD